MLGVTGAVRVVGSVTEIVRGHGAAMIGGNRGDNGWEKYGQSLLGVMTRIDKIAIFQLFSTFVVKLCFFLKLNWC